MGIMNLDNFSTSILKTFKKLQKKNLSTSHEDLRNETRKNEIPKNVHMTQFDIKHQNN